MDELLPPWHRVLYLKGGRALEEAARLYPRVGDLPDGGPDKFLLAVMYYCRQCVLHLCSFGPENKSQRVYGKQVTEYSARSDSTSRVWRRFAFIRALLAFAKDGVAFRPTIIVCGVDGPFALMALFIAKVCGARFIFSAHNALALPSTSRPYKLANGMLCRSAHVVITHGPFVRQEAISLGANPQDVIEFNNGLDAQHIALIESLPPKREGEPAKVLYVGRIEVDKGVVDLLNAFVAANVPGTELHYVGSGSGIELLRAKIHENGVSNRVFMHGPVPFESVFSHLHEATIAVTPSQSKFPEGFCKSAMEAMFTGTPVISPDYGPFPYLVSHESNGLLYEVDNTEDLALKIRIALTDTEMMRRMNQGAARTGRALMKPETGFATALRKALCSGQKSPDAIFKKDER